MNCVKRIGVYALFLGGVIGTQGFKSTAKGEGSREGRAGAVSTSTSASAPAMSEFQWSDHTKLSWEDFRGPVQAEDDQSAAATHCGMGFKTVTDENGQPKIVVYNKFYVNKSWVRDDAKLQEILDHEQGHFDLCELYTRKLRERMNAFDFNGSRDVRQALYDIYFEVNAAYEKRQQAYEDETTHGIVTAQQKKWQRMIALEMSRELAMN
ncbi:MAG: hypothetical protein V4649_13095 [Bacteroidota bacterium]